MNQLEHLLAGHAMAKLSFSPAIVAAVPADQRGVNAAELVVLGVEKWKKNDEDDEDQNEYDGNARGLAHDSIVVPLVPLLIP